MLSDSVLTKRSFTGPHYLLLKKFEAAKLINIRLEEKVPFNIDLGIIRGSSLEPDRTAKVDGVLNESNCVVPYINQVPAKD